MNISYRLRVVLDGGEKKRGTAWFLREDLVVTALHVVADDTGQWLSDVLPNVQYRLELEGSDPIGLEPVAADARTDIALLRSVKPVTGATVLSVAAEALPKPGANWNSVGYPEFHSDAFGLSGTVTTVHSGTSQSTLQLYTREGTRILWEGISGSPVQIGSEVAGVITRATYGPNTVWAAPAVAVQALLEFSRSSPLIGELSVLLCDEYREPADLEHLSQPVPTDLSSYTTLAEAVRSLTERAWRSGPHAFATLLARLSDDHPESPRVAALQKRLTAPPGTGEGISQARLVREVMQLLSDPRSPGVALLEPLRFGARQIVEQVMDKLKEASRPELPVRLVPEPNTGDEARLYGKLQRDLRRGLERGFGRPLPPAWGDCLPTTGAADGHRFEEQLERLLDGPVREERRVLVLVIEGFSRVAEQQLEFWANMLSRLAGVEDSPLKLLVWGGADLHALCAGYRHLQLFSPFERLTRRTVGPLSGDEVNQAMMGRLGVAVNILYTLTDGHPGLVYELLDHASVELRHGDEQGLRSRCLTASAHLQGLKKRLETDAAALAVLRRLLGGEKERQGHEEEERLRWLGIIAEEGAGNWRWAAPILEDWANRWLD